MVESPPPSSFEVVEAKLSLQLRVVPLDPPAYLRESDQQLHRRFGRHRREPVFCRRLRSLRPFEEQPLLGPRSAKPIISRRHPNASSGESGGKHALRSLPPRDLLPPLGTERPSYHPQVDRAMELVPTDPYQGGPTPFHRSGGKGCSPSGHTVMALGTPTT